MIAIVVNSRWLEGASLAVWGLAIVLAWTGLARLFCAGRIELYMRGYMSEPKHLPQPMKTSNEVAASVVAILTAVGIVAGFTVPAINGLFGWEVAEKWAHAMNPAAALIRVHAALALELYFLHKISLTPSYKMRWSVAWYGFCLMVGALQ